MDIIECPDCGFGGTNTEFEISLSDECFCPECGCEFLLPDEDDEYEDQSED